MNRAWTDLRRWLHWRLAPRDPRAQLLYQNWRTRRPGAGHSVAIFSHFDPGQRIDDYVVTYIGELAGAGLEVVFVTTCEAISDVELDRVRNHCAGVIVRRNLTLDFGSWRVALSELPEWRHFARLVLCNDSCYGPLFPLSPWLHKMNPQTADVWALTDSEEQRPHLQSYFLLFHAAALLHPALDHFWADFRFLSSKHQIIQRYEVGLSDRLRAAGLRLAAAVPYALIEEQARRGDFQYANLLRQGPLNPTLFMWDLLVRDFQFPFIKTELFKKDRFASRALTQWRVLLKAVPAYPPELIEQHRTRFTRTPGATE